MNSPVSKNMLNVSADYPDLRDRYYQPNLTPLKPFIDPPGNLVILDQGKRWSVYRLCIGRYH